MSRLLCIALVVVCCAAFGAALSCYDCTGTYQSQNNCFDPFASAANTVTVCPADKGPQVCYKQKSGSGSTLSVKRGCQSGTQVSGCDPAAPGDGPASCFCNTDKCNGSGKGAVAGGLLVALTAVLLRFF